MWRAFGVGAAAGLVWGVVARGFMRLLAEVPEFSWAGTLGIIGVATVVGGAVGLVRRARTDGRSRWWRLVALPFVLLFTAAGALFLPGALGIAASRRGGWFIRVVGALLVGVSVWAVVDESRGVPPARQALGLLIAFGCLAVEGWALGEVVRRWAPRPARVVEPGLSPAGLPA
jgi:uncharacterized membrane protein YhaH (DUF805 family)